MRALILVFLCGALAACSLDPALDRSIAIEDSRIATYPELRPLTESHTVDTGRLTPQSGDDLAYRTANLKKKAKWLLAAPSDG